MRSALWPEDATVRSPLSLLGTLTALTQLEWENTPVFPHPLLFLSVLCCWSCNVPLAALLGGRGEEAPPTKP